MKYVVAVAVIVAVAVGLAWQRTGAIERNLAGAVEAALEAADAKSVRVSVDGLDVSLAGEVENSETKVRLERAIGRIPNVGGFTSQIQVTAPTTPSSTDEVVAWANCQLELDEVLATGTIDFASSRADLDPASEPLLDRLVAPLLECIDARVEIGGHTDASGPREGNLALSLQRAEAVKGYLTAAGVEGERLDAVGYGPDQPLVDNATPEGRARNRRIEFKVLEP